MKDFRVPGVAWALLIVVAVALIHEYQLQLPGDPVLWDFVVVLLVGVLKSLNLGTDQLEQALAVIEALRVRISGRRVRAADATMEAAPLVVNVAEVEPLLQQAPQPPNRMVRWLFG